MPEQQRRVVWTPEQRIAQFPSNMERFARWVEEREGTSFAGYEALHRWSVEDVARFWSAAAEFLGVRFHTRAADILQGGFPNASWFPGATLNYAEHCMLPGDSQSTAVVAYTEAGDRREVTRSQLRADVARIQVGLLELGVGAGDRVAAFLPNRPESIAAMLATAGLGAIWTSCAPDFGVDAVVARWQQVEPKVMLAVPGYQHRGRYFDRSDVVEAIRDRLPSVHHLVLLDAEDHGGPAGTADIGRSIAWERAFGAELSGDVTFEAVPFDHPVAIMFSSGTTGAPKPIVHGHGGFVLEHLKWFVLHEDLTPEDRVFWFSSTGWLAWNLGISTLMTGSTLVTLEGDSMHPTLESYWQRLADERVTYLGVSPGFLAACRDAGLVPRKAFDLSSLRTVTAGGSPMPAALFHWVYDAVGTDLYLASSSGGTDVAGSIVGGNQMLPVVAGAIACRLLAVDAAAYSSDGEPLVAGDGELVIQQPMPSMPLGFWNDEGGRRFHEAYFARFPDVWSHGDWISFGADGTCVVTGRSDATLNRGGVRIGTSEVYSAVERQAEVADSLVVHLEDPAGGVGTLLLFVKLRDGDELTDDLQSRLRHALRTSASPRHVPDAIYEIPEVPRTATGKKLEVPVKRILQGFDPQVELAKSGADDPAVVEWFTTWTR
ncbi:acetoacetate--CoA ligase [Nocardioides sp.]|uniref:acetoacetate--CoA ligase n=1 Tax=Nocardioides sp. TaxID=35761 RepID=UPI00260B9196|nr:acetoacetate--CoA ligase [Nocardioides sp.]MCW2737962.1 acetoacetate--CoA ligase [Nocardioides sp.]